MRRRFTVCFIILMVVRTAFAQASDKPNYTANDYSIALQSVAARQTAYDQSVRGWRAGSIMLKPSLDMTAGYSDNIRGTSRNRLSDTALRTTAAMQANSIRRDRGFESAFRLQHVLFKTYTAQDQSNAAFRLSPFFALAGGWTVSGQTVITYDHELSSAESAQPLANEPTPYTHYDFGGQLQHSRGRLKTEFFAAYNILTFNNTTLINGGRAINNDRNRADVSGGVACAWQNTAHDQSLGWRHEWLQQNFTRADFNTFTSTYNGFNRDNHGWRSQLTAQWQPTHLLQLDGRIGVERKEFSVAQWHARTTPVGTLRALYLLTPLTNIHLDLKQTVATTSFDNAPAFTQKSVQIGLTHELTRRLVADIAVNRAQSDYWDNARHDVTSGGGMTLHYRQNDAVKWHAGYSFQQRDSSFAVASYQENRVMVGTHIRF